MPPLNHPPVFVARGQRDRPIGRDHRLGPTGAYEAVQGPIHEGGLPRRRPDPNGPATHPRPATMVRTGQPFPDWPRGGTHPIGPMTATVAIVRGRPGGAVSRQSTCEGGTYRFLRQGVAEVDAGDERPRGKAGQRVILMKGDPQPLLDPLAASVGGPVLPAQTAIDQRGDHGIDACRAGQRAPAAGPAGVLADRYSVAAQGRQFSRQSAEGEPGWPLGRDPKGAGRRVANADHAWTSTVADGWESLGTARCWHSRDQSTL